MTYLEVFEYNIIFDTIRAGDREIKKFIAADSKEEAENGVEMLIRKIFENGLVATNNIRKVTAEPITDEDYEKATFGKFEYNLGKLKEKFSNFIKDEPTTTQ